MSSRLDFYFRQRVTEAELDLAFALLEQADRNLSSDIGVFGLVHGADAAPHTPVADLTIHLSAPAVGYDRLGQRIFFGTEQRVDCSVDDAGLPTAVAAVGKERWLGVFLRFDRLLSDPRTDGNSQQVYFRRDESFQLVVRQGAEANAGAAQKLALQPDELLVCDVLRRFGQTQLVAGDLDASRRQSFKFVTGDAVEVVSGAWAAIAPAVPTVQAAFDAADELLAEHFRGTAHLHTAAHVAATPHGFLAATNVQAALDELVDDLATSTAGSPGALRVGADAVAGAPNALPAGTVDSQLAQLLGWLNAHLAAPVRAHAASAISAAPHNTISGTNVQAQLQEIVTALAATTAGAAGATLVGADALAGAPSAIPAGTVQQALAALLDLVNAHAARAAGAHAASAIALADAADLLNAGDVEKAIAEVVDAYGKDHFRANEATAGQHRTIHQPKISGLRALLWDSEGNGGAGGHLRVYSDGDLIWFTLNAVWTGTGWARDSVDLTSGGFRFSRGDFAFFHEPAGAPTFLNWSRTWELPMAASLNNSGLEVSGSIQEVGRVALYFTNPEPGGPHMIQAGGAVTFRSRFRNVPSSVTLTPTDVGPNLNGNPQVTSIDRDGFVYFATPVLPPLASTSWLGKYTAIA